MRIFRILQRLTTALLTLWLVAAPGSPARALAIIIDQDASWRYINATPATTMAVPGDWFAKDFDDSGWFAGNAPFTSNPGNPAATFGGDLANAGTPYGGAAPAIPAAGTLWNVPFDPYLRISFNMAAPAPLTVWIAVDNGINAMYLNGVLSTGNINAEGQGFRWEHVFDIGAEYTLNGENVLALQLEDHGGATAFALVLTEDDSADNPIFTDNDPPPPNPTNGIPEPGTLALFAFGLTGLAILRRRKTVAKG